MVWSHANPASEVMMFRSRVLLPLLLLLVAPGVGGAQVPDWRPPAAEMPMMPTAAEVRGDWRTPNAAWFRGVEGVTGAAVSSLRATGEATSSGRTQMVRFSNGAVPAVVWSDRNGDGRADMIEIFRSGGVIIQVIDANFNGRANVMRVYDSEGKLLSQNPI
jgi:hypothetical protein